MFIPYLGSIDVLVCLPEGWPRVEILIGCYSRDCWIDRKPPVWNIHDHVATENSAPFLMWMLCRNIQISMSRWTGTLKEAAHCQRKWRRSIPWSKNILFDKLLSHEQWRPTFLWLSQRVVMGESPNFAFFFTCLMLEYQYELPRHDCSN